jgi:hypothetical protein
MTCGVCVYVCSIYFYVSGSNTNTDPIYLAPYCINSPYDR